MKRLYELREILCDELDKMTGEIAKGKMSQSHLEMAQKLTDTIKNIDKICMLEENGGYSQAGRWEARIDGEYGRRNSYDYNDGNSQARGGNCRGDGYGNDRMSYRRGYSRDDAKEEMMDKLEDLMYETGDGKTKEAIKKCLDNLKQM